MTSESEPLGGDDQAVRALIEGAESILAKMAETWEVLEAEEQVLRGQERSIAQKLIQAGVSIAEYKDEDQSAAEMATECLNYARASASNKEIMELLRQSALQQYIGTIAYSLISYQGDHDAELTKSFKKEDQICILDDLCITSIDKAALLDVYDELVPIAGLDLTNQAEIESLRKQRNDDLEVMDFRESARVFIDRTVNEDLLPVYGQHDDLQKLSAAVRSLITLEYKFLTGKISEDKRDVLRQIHHKELMAAADNIGIEPLALANLLHKAKKLLQT